RRRRGRQEETLRRRSLGLGPLRHHRHSPGAGMAVFGTAAANRGSRIRGNDIVADQIIASGHFPHRVGIDAYGNGGFRFADMSHKGSLLCLPTGMYGWEVADASALTLESLRPALECADELDVLLIGLG